MDNFPANKPKPPTRQVRKEEPKKVERVVKGDVVRRKKPLGRRLSEAFLGGDARSVGEYVVLDVLIPAAKDTIADAVSQGVERMVFGEVRSTSRRTGARPSRSYTPYGAMGSQRVDEPRSLSRSARARHNFDEVIVPTRVEAVEVIDSMAEEIEKYGQTSVASLYQLVGITPTHVDPKWGWVDASGFGLTRVRDGYLLDLPKPEPLD